MRGREPNPRAKWILVSCFIVLFVGLGSAVIGFLSREKVHHERQVELPVQLDTDTGLPPSEPLEPLAVPASTTGQTIQQATAQCDADAAKDGTICIFC